MDSRAHAGTRLIDYGEDVRAIAASATHAFAANGAGELVAIDLHTAARRALAGPNARGAVAWVTTSGGHVFARRNIGAHDTIVRIPQGGGEEEVIADDVRAASFAVDGGWVFWVDGAGGGVKRVSVHGGAQAAIAPIRRGPLPLGRPRAASRIRAGEIWADSGYVVWTALHGADPGASPLALFRVGADGGEPEIVIPDLEGAPAIAVGAGVIVWSARGGEHRALLQRAPLSGGAPEPIAARERAPCRLGIQGGALYLLDREGECRVYRAPLDGRGAIEEVRGLLPSTLRGDRVAIGPSGIVGATSRNVLYLPFQEAPGAVDLANRPPGRGAVARGGPAPEGDRPPGELRNVGEEQRALEDEVDRLVHRRFRARGAAIARVPVTFEAKIASYWRVSYSKGYPRPALVGAAVEPTAEVIEAFERATALEHEQRAFERVTIVHARGAAPESPRPGGVRFEDLDAYRGRPRLEDVTARQRAFFARAEASPPASWFAPELFEPLRGCEGDGRQVACVRRELTDALRGPGGARILLSGDPGSGKTFVLREIARALESIAGAPTPLLVDASPPGQPRSAPDRGALRALLARQFERIGISQIDPDAILGALAERRAVLLVDHLGASDLSDFDSATGALARLFRDLPATASAIIACRKTQLRSRADELTALGQISSTGGGRVIDLLPFAPRQIRSALERRLALPPRIGGTAGRSHAVAVRRAPDLASIVQHPRFLAIFAALPEREIRGRRAAAIVDALLSSRAAMESDRHARTDDRAAMKLAAHLWASGVDRIDPAAFPRALITEVFAPIDRRVPAPRRAYLLANCGYLTRDERGAVSFPAEALVDWFVASDAARQLLLESRHTDLEDLVDLLRERPLTPRIVGYFAAALTRSLTTSVDPADPDAVTRRAQLREDRSDAERARRELHAWGRRVMASRGADRTLAGNARALLAALGDPVVPKPGIRLLSPQGSKSV